MSSNHQAGEPLRTSPSAVSAAIPTSEKVIGERGVSVWHVGGDDLRYRIPMMHRLLECGIRVTAIGAEDSSPFDAAGIEYHRYPLVRPFAPYADYRAMKHLASLFETYRPDVVHAFHTKPSMLAMYAAAKAKVPVRIRSVTGMGFIYASQSVRALALRPAYKYFQSRASRVADHTIFQNTDDHQYFCEKGLVPSGAASVIPGSGIDLNAFVFDGARKKAVREDLQLADRPTVTMISRMVRWKGVVEFLKAARRIRETQDVNFLLVGGLSVDPRQGVSLEEIESYSDVVRYLGHRTDVADILSATDVFVLPSYYREGVPRSLLEASAARVPIVTTDMPGCRDVVEHGVNGFLVEPRNAGALAKRVSELLTDPVKREQMGVKGYTRVRECFNIESVADQYVELYRHYFGAKSNLKRQAN